MQTETGIVSSGTLSPALRLPQHFISSNLLIGPMDYERRSTISRFLALLPENLQQTPLSSLAECRGCVCGGVRGVDTWIGRTGKGNLHVSPLICIFPTTF